MTPTSIKGRLALGLGLVALLGSIALMGLVGLEYGTGAENPADLTRLAHEVGDHVVAPLIILLGLVAVAGSLVIRSALQPLEQAAREVDAAALKAPRGVRIDQAALPAEARPFAEAVNRLLARLDQAAEAQEAFAADAAHELKTPLAILSLELARLPDELAAPLREDVADLARLVDQLLLLARLDAQSAAETAREPVDLKALGSSLAGALAPLALKTGRNLAFEDAAPTEITGRREAVAAALRNLVENALRVTPAGGTVTIVAGPGARLAVRDEGPGLSSARLAELSRRGQRADHASAQGAGLGLAIVARIMAAQGGDLRSDQARRELVLEFS